MTGSMAEFSLDKERTDGSQQTYQIARKGIANALVLHVLSPSQNIEGNTGNKEKGLHGSHALDQIGHGIGLNRIERPQAGNPNGITDRVGTAEEMTVFLIQPARD